MLPIVVSEDLVHPFNFYLKAAIQQGMRHQGELYGLVYEFKVTERLKAYQRACELVERGMAVIVTASTHRYALWMSLRSQDSFQALVGQQAPLTAKQKVCAAET